MKFAANAVFKSIKKDASSHHRFPLPGSETSTWPLPQTDRTGDWIGPVSFSAEKPIKAHSWGIHLSKRENLIYWLGERNFIAEYKGVCHETRDAMAVEYARLVREIHLPRQEMISLALDFCREVLPLADVMEFDWTIGQTMQSGFDAAAAYLEAPRKPSSDFAKDKASRLAALCATNADYRFQDARNSFQYTHGCLAIAHASRAISLLPSLKNKSKEEAIAVFKQIAFDCRQSIALAVEENAYRADINEAAHRPLHSVLQRWTDPQAPMQPHHQALVAVGVWQNNALLSALKPKRIAVKPRP